MDEKEEPVQKKHMDEKEEPVQNWTNGLRRPYKFTRIKQEYFLGCLRLGMRRGEAAKCVGISRQQAMNYASAVPEYMKAIEEAEMSANDLMEDALWKTGIEGNVIAQKFWLLNRSPEKWQDKRAANIAVIAPNQLTKEQLEIEARKRGLIE